MLALAAANRWRLAPRLAGASACGDFETLDIAFAAMRRSLIVEASVALMILALVGWFGTLEPFADAA